MRFGSIVEHLPRAHMVLKQGRTFSDWPFCHSYGEACQIGEFVRSAGIIDEARIDDPGVEAIKTLCFFVDLNILPTCDFTDQSALSRPVNAGGEEKIDKEKFTGEPRYVLILGRQLGLKFLLKIFVLRGVRSVDEASLELLQIGRAPNFVIWPKEGFSFNQRWPTNFLR